VQDENGRYVTDDNERYVTAAERWDKYNRDLEERYKDDDKNNKQRGMDTLWAMVAFAFVFIVACSVFSAIRDGLARYSHLQWSILPVLQSLRLSQVRCRQGRREVHRANALEGRRTPSSVNRFLSRMSGVRSR